MLTGLDLTFMCLTRSNSSLFSTPGFVVSPVGKRERGEERKKKKKGRMEKGNRKGQREGRREEGIKKDRRQEGILTKIKT